MAIFLTNPLIDSLKPKPPEDPQQPEQYDFNAPDAAPNAYYPPPQPQPQYDFNAPDAAPNVAPFTPSYQPPYQPPQPYGQSYDEGFQPASGGYSSGGGSSAATFGDVYSRFGQAADVTRNMFFPTRNTPGPIGAGVGNFVDSGMASVQPLFDEMRARKARGEELFGNPFGVGNTLNATIGNPALSASVTPPEVPQYLRENVPYVGNTLADLSQMAGAPGTYIGGFGPKVFAGMAAGGGLLEAGGTLMGADEQQRAQLAQAGMLVGPIAPTIGRLGLRGLGALDSALNPADLRAAAPEAFQYGRGNLDAAGNLRAAAVRPEDLIPKKTYINPRGGVNAGASGGADELTRAQQMAQVRAEFAAKNAPTSFEGADRLAEYVRAWGITAETLERRGTAEGSAIMRPGLKAAVQQRAVESEAAARSMIAENPAGARQVLQRVHDEERSALSIAQDQLEKLLVDARGGKHPRVMEAMDEARGEFRRAESIVLKTRELLDEVPSPRFPFSGAAGGADVPPGAVPPGGGAEVVRAESARAAEGKFWAPADLAPPADGYTRMYRGVKAGQAPQGSQDQFFGKWFTPDAEYALSYASGGGLGPSGRVYFADVPTAEIESMSASALGLLGGQRNHFIVPAKYASKGMPETPLQWQMYYEANPDAIPSAKVTPAAAAPAARPPGAVPPGGGGGTGLSPQERAMFEALQARQGGSTQPTAQRIVPEINNAPWASGSPELQEAVPQIQDAMRAEIALRRSGVAEAEKAAARARQIAGIEGNLAGAAGSSFDETLGAARSGARVGRMRQTFAAPMDLTEVSKSALGDHLISMVENLPDLANRSYQKLNGLTALDSLYRGDGLQPNQIKLLGRVFGNDFAKLAADANAGRPSAIATLSAEAKAAIEAGKKVKIGNIVRLEQRAAAQTTLADDLIEQWRMNPTDKRLKAVADDARARGLKFANQAEQLKISEGKALAEELEISGVMERTKLPLTTQQEQAIQAAKASGESGLRRLEIQHKAMTDAADKLEALAAERENAPRYAKAARLARERADAFAARATEVFDRLNPDEQELIDKALALLGETEGVSAALDRESIKSVEYWIKSARQYRQSIGETTYVRMAQASAQVTGNLADAYLNTLFHNRLVAERALTIGGTDPVIARQVADLLVESQLKARYPDGVPARLLAEIEKNKSIASSTDLSDVMLRGAAAAQQEWKNLAFGPADFGVLGQQVFRATTQMGPTNIIVGAANRVLNRLRNPLFNDPLVATPGDVAARIQYARDGLAVGEITGAVQPTEGLDALSKFGGPAGRGAARWIAYNTKLQFVNVLGGLRNLNHEGNLAILNALGRDITDPAVRATSARFANVATSYSPPALNARRAAFESATMMTPSMRRASVEGIVQMAQTIGPNSTPEQRILGAILIVNKYAVATAIGMAINHYAGVGDYESDISKPKRGSITTKIKNAEGVNIVVQTEPQDQVENAVAASVRALAEADPETLAKVWAKLAIGTSGPVLQVGEKAVGFGFQPDSGYALGGLLGTKKFGEGQSLGQQALGLLPAPPVVQSLIKGTSPVGAALDVAGVQNYAEAPSAAVDRGDFESLSGEAQLQGLRRKTWNEVKFVAGDDAPASFYEWNKKQSRELIAKYLAAGQNILVAEDTAEKVMKKNDVAKLYRANFDDVEDGWAILNPRLAYEILLREKDLKFYEKTFSPSPTVKAFVVSASQTTDAEN